MLHLKEILRFSKKKKKKTAHKLEFFSPNFNSHGYASKLDNMFQVWDKYLHVQSCGILGLQGRTTYPCGSSFSTMKDIIATTQTYCDHPDIWLDSHLWEKREERAEKIPATAL